MVKTTGLRKIKIGVGNRTGGAQEIDQYRDYQPKYVKEISDALDKEGFEIGMMKTKKSGNIISMNTKKVSMKGIKKPKIKKLKIKKSKKKKAEIKLLKKDAKKVLKNDKDIALDFAEKAHGKFDRMIKASILFGSQAKNTAGVESDIDIVLIIDDASIGWDLELISWYREELGKLIAAQKYSRDLHINTVKLTTWWMDLMHGDPVVLNIVRYGEALIDSGGFFNPIKALLIQGKIKSTPEAVYAALQRAPAHIARSKSAELGAIEGVYWAIIDSAQAALIMAGRLPPGPEHIPAMLKTTFVDKGMMKISSVQAVRDIYDLHKTISHGQVNDIEGVQIDKWQDTAESFLREMTQLIDKLIEEDNNSGQI